MSAQENHAHRHRIVRTFRPDHFAQPLHVAQRLAHLFIVERQETVVNPVAHRLAVVQFFAVRAFGLSFLVFVMRKEQILAAAVNVEGHAQMLARHGGAFQMPARSALSPRRFPKRFAGLRELP